ncbi:hypothetical protein [Winogradskyella vincentii]|uniref:Uncharacterized protein n=1 Tax=Winogradskyella vincentii TaxID=2877122 RepID=A0ABS7Y2V8_9FLAO|nr:hypothetical protein [Winogradskyella vincentii]MCA0154269.1 hypothetical protein [Winogradskyella vincentii]
MIKFFRNIRKQLLTENKTGKYFKYAIGEIVLVVIGILIALQINNWNAQKQVEEKVENIFAEILVELSADIKQTTNLMRFYEVQDTLTNLVLKNRLTYNDYANSQFSGKLYYLTLNRWFITLTNFSYDNLLNYSDAIPLKFRDVTNQLNSLYTYRKKGVENGNEKTIDFVNKNLMHLNDNYEWYSMDIPDSQNHDAINFMLNSYKYKNTVKTYRILGFDHLQAAVDYRVRAIECYQEIAQLLDKPVIDESFKFNDDVIHLLSGEWGCDELPNLKVRFIVKNNRLFWSSNQDSKLKELFFIYQTKGYVKIMSRSREFYTILKKGSFNVIKSSEGLEFKK